MSENTPQHPWNASMPDDQFDFMRRVLAAPSPVGLEAAMTYGVLKPYMESYMPESWTIHQYKGNAGIVLDTHPGRDDLPSVMVVGHADKIRMQVRHISDDGKIWINTDSFLPMTLLGNPVTIFSEDPKDPGSYRTIQGGTVEAIGAIHFAPAKLRSGDSGIRKEQIYVELQIHGENRKEQILDLGIRSGDPILLDRPIRRGFSKDTFTGAYLDNGLGCFIATEVGKLLASNPTTHVRYLGAIATHEEIGRLGSRVLAGVHKPDMLIAVDVSHDYEAAPGIKDRRMTPTRMGAGYSLACGSIVSEQLNAFIQRASIQHDIPMQRVVVGRDTGTDAMAAVFASIDCAATSIGFPIRNMHTISETGHTGDVLGAIHAIHKTLLYMDDMAKKGTKLRSHLKNNHPRLDLAKPLS